MSRRVISPSGLAEVDEQFRYSYAIVEDGTLYHSGQVGRDPGGKHVTESFEEQARQAFANVERILDAVGKRFADVNKVTAYLTDVPRDAETYRAVRDEFIEEPYPAATMLGVNSLSFEDLAIELEVEVPVDETDLD